MRKLFDAAIIIVAFILLIGCGAAPGTDGPFAMSTASATGILDANAGQACTDPAIRGTISRVFVTDAEDDGNRVLGMIVIDSIRDPNMAYAQAQVTVTEQTVILEQIGNEHRPSTFEALIVGTDVEACFTGPVLESFPVQATARRITRIAPE